MEPPASDLRGDCERPPSDLRGQVLWRIERSIYRTEMKMKETIKGSRENEER